MNEQKIYTINGIPVIVVADSGKGYPCFACTLFDRCPPSEDQQSAGLKSCSEGAHHYVAAPTTGENK